MLLQLLGILITSSVIMLWNHRRVLANNHDTLRIKVPHWPHSTIRGGWRRALDLEVGNSIWNKYVASNAPSATTFRETSSTVMKISAKTLDTPRTYGGNMYHFVTNTMLINSIAPLVPEISAGTVVTKFGPRLCVGGQYFKGYRWDILMANVFAYIQPCADDNRWTAHIGNIFDEFDCELQKEAKEYMDLCQKHDKVITRKLFPH